MKSKAILILPPHQSDIDKCKQPGWTISRIPPIGLLSIGSYLNAKGHDIKIIDCREVILSNKTRDYIQFIIQIVDEFKPDMVGINVLTALFDEAQKISRELKKRFPNLLIIAGGPHPSIEPILTFKQNEFIDAICIGPGEEVCLDVLEGDNIRYIKGLMYRNSIDSFRKRDVVLDIDKYPFPNFGRANSNFYSGFTINTASSWGYRGLAAITSRSCPYSCKFCASDWSKPFRYHSAQYTIEMTKQLAKFDIDVIPFFDDTIGAQKERLYEICEGFINSKLFWPHTSRRYSAAMRANQINRDTLKMMKKAGCFSISIGIESGSDRMLKVIDKKTTVEMNKWACAYVLETGLYLNTSFMLGIPGETEAEMKETLAFMQNVKSHCKGIGSFRPLPGSPFYYEFINSKKLSKENIDWSNLGDFSAIPKYLFCDTSREKFNKIFWRALEIGYGAAYTAIHEDTLSKYPEITNIANKTEIKICKPDNYVSSSHISYSSFSIYLIFNSIVRRILPWRLRNRIWRILASLRGKWAS